MTTAPELSEARIAQAKTISSIGNYAFGWADSDAAGAVAKRGLNPDVVRDISAKKDEPEWMLARRLKALQLFEREPMPTWGADLSGIDFDTIKYFVRASEKQAATWDDLPADIKNTYDRLGIPEAEKQRLVGGVAAQYESEVVYHKIREDLEEQGVIFLDTDSGSAGAPGDLRGVLRLGHPVRGQQVLRAEHRGVVGRVVRLRAAGRARARSRCRPTSGSTRRTWASSSGR
jgi:Fe-S cluster assembly protein SufB